MIVGETVLAMTLFCTSPKRKRTGRELHSYTSDNTCQNFFQLASGTSLEWGLKMELENIDGVRDVSIKQTGNDYVVKVTLDRLDFSIFEKVIQRELELFDSFPDLRFHFDVMPAVATDDTDLVRHAA